MRNTETEALGKHSIMLSLIHRCSFVCLAIMLMAIFCPESAEASSLDPQKGVVTAPDDVPIHYTTYGDGSPTLVFVHGISCDQSYWKEQVGPFSRDFRVVSIDLAGHGESGLGRKDWSMEAYGGDVSAVVKALKLENVILIGHSMGGAVIFKAARHMPGRVKGLVAVDTFEDFSSWYTTEEIEEWVKPFYGNYLQETRTWIQSMFVAGTDPAWVEQITTDMQGSPPQVMIPSMESALRLMFGHEVSTLLQGLDIPVVVINSDQEPTKIESMKRDGVDVYLIQGVGHFLMLEDPESFNSTLSNVIKSLDG